MSGLSIVTAAMESPDRFLYASDHPGFLALTQETWQNRWFPSQISLHEDSDEVRLLSPTDREFYQFLFTFLGMAESLVNFNIEDLVKEFSNHDVTHYYAEQVAMENIHGKVYANILNLFFGGNRGDLMTYAKKIVEDATLAKKIDWLHSRVRKATTRAEKVLLFLVIEGIYFISSFYSIGLFRLRGVMRGVCLANDYISRDELLHTRAAGLLYNTMISRDESPSVAYIHGLFREAVEIETLFIRSKSRGVTMVNVGDIEQFLQATADRILKSINVPPLFGARPPNACPLSYTSAKSVNFFERDNSEYVTSVHNDL
ncbi:JM118 [macacine gammaherpesvirus 11]|uniref:ribonucleoside-diphosphate reductase n=2 Tax=macacine gammaherpesvirus 11 TaxID=2560570 RepID=G9JMC6_9GAMA|nr:JM118 [Macaca fuscata rhadinovirus]AAT00095.1 JM118 [Macaca fuscata rhadinovirus]AEW87643.1 JM118 [Macaca fuscata rhadinovirus]AEW87813.1 JM118 [Macaca fuscata rhadinovirus]